MNIGDTDSAQAEASRIAPPPYELPAVESFFPQLEYRADAPLYFVHVPKCAGTTIRTALESAYDGDRTFPSGSTFTQGSYLSYIRFRSSGERLDQYDLVSSHFCALALQHLRPDTNCFIWLREPRDRTTSAFFFFVIQEGAHNRNSYYQRLTAGERRETVFMDWLRAAPAGTTRYQLDLVGGRLGPLYEEWVAQNPGRNVTEHAVSLLRRCFFIGLLEDNERSLDAFSLITNTLLPTPVTVRRNRGARRELGLSLSPEEQREFDELMAPDVRFYDLIRKVYDRQMANIASAARQRPELSLIGDREAVRQHLIHRHGSLASRSLGAWRAFERVSENNLDNREQHVLPDGTVRRWRWTGPEADTHLYFKLPRSRSHQLRIVVNSATPQQNVATATVALNGRQVPLELVVVPGVGFHLQGHLSAGLLSSLPEIADLQISTPTMLNESDLGEKVYSRSLGIAIEGISLEPITVKSTLRAAGSRLRGRATSIARRLRRIVRR